MISGAWTAIASFVRTGPGASSVMWTPCPETSPRSDSLKVFTNAFDAA